MVLRKLKKLFGRDSRAYMHPRNNMGELIVCQRLDETLRERNATSKTFHGKVSVLKGCKHVVQQLVSE